MDLDRSVKRSRRRYRRRRKGSIPPTLALVRLRHNAARGHGDEGIDST